MTAVYIAASSLDMARAKRWRTALLEAGLAVTSTWIESIEAVGEANPATATREQRLGWAQQCATGVRNANILWLLSPPLDAPSCGAWCELGVAQNNYTTVVCSGPTTHQSIFCALGAEYASDFEAFAAICLLHQQDVFIPFNGGDWD